MQTLTQEKILVFMHTFFSLLKCIKGSIHGRATYSKRLSIRNGIKNQFMVKAENGRKLSFSIHYLEVHVSGGKTLMIHVAV